MNGSPEPKPKTWSGNWRILSGLLPYFKEFPDRIAIAGVCLILSKLAGVSLPFAIKYVVDALDASKHQALAVPVGMLLLYGVLRFVTILLGEIRDSVFGRVTERAMRRVGLKVFRHLHTLDLDYHLSRRTGGLSRDIERGVDGISFIMRFMLFNILPTIFEITLVAIILTIGYNYTYALIILVSVTLYVIFSIVVTEWRTDFIRRMNELDSKSHTRAIDSLLNYETVKYFTNEEHEAEEYDKNLAEWEIASMRSRMSLAALNTGQSLVVAASITLMMLLAAYHVSIGRMTLGDLVLVNSYMMQLFIPLNFLGFVYREIKRALTDVEHMVSIMDRSSKISDLPGATAMNVRGGHVRYDRVGFSYKEDRSILHDVCFDVPAGRKVAIVGPSGAGKSTIARLLFRFYDVGTGVISIDGQDIRSVTQHSLRRAIGVVPQDTVLFNDTIRYNIAYGRPGATDDEVREAARMAHLDGFIEQLPEGYETKVGERGLKISGGEKQRVAIARMLLKRPSIMVFDEATSSLDSTAEQAILAALREIAADTTTLVIAHRLSTVIDADNIIVLRHGSVVEQGRHEELLERHGVYARMWELQQHNRHEPLKLAAVN